MTDDPTDERLQGVADWLAKAAEGIGLQGAEISLALAPEDALRKFVTVVERVGEKDDEILKRYFAALTCARAMLAWIETAKAGFDEYERRWPGDYEGPDALIIVIGDDAPDPGMN